MYYVCMYVCMCMMWYVHDTSENAIVSHTSTLYVCAMHGSPHQSCKDTQARAQTGQLRNCQVIAVTLILCFVARIVTIESNHNSRSNQHRCEALFCAMCTPSTGVYNVCMYILYYY